MEEESIGEVDNYPIGESIFTDISKGIEIKYPF